MKRSGWIKTDGRHVAEHSQFAEQAGLGTCSKSTTKTVTSMTESILPAAWYYNLFYP